MGIVMGFILCYNTYMKKIDLDNVLYHGLLHYLSRHPRVDKSITKLNSILKCGAILSRTQQSLILPTLDLPENKYSKVVWNGLDYISICKKQGYRPEYPSEAFSQFVESGISIVLDKSVLDKGYIMPDQKQEGEYQIKDQIEADYFIGITINFLSDKQQAEHTKRFFIERGLSLNECSEVLNRRYGDIQKVRECLDNNGFDYLQIYSINDGNIITNPQNVIAMASGQYSAQENCEERQL